MKKIFIFMYLLIVIHNITFGQKITDFQTRSGISLKYNLPKGWDISAQYQIRMINNTSTYRGSYISIETDKKLSEHFSLTSGYRLALVDNGKFHRYSFGVEAKQDFGRLKVSFRPMIQYQKQNFVEDDETSTDTDTFIRTRVLAKYPINRKLDVYAYAEPFYKVDKNPSIDRWKNSAGFKYEFAKGMKANLYYTWQPDLSHKELRTNHIMGVNFEFTIK